MLKVNSKKFSLNLFNQGFTAVFKLLQGLTNTPKLGARSKSGYILFSAVVRKKIMTENPTCPFGVISKLVGVEVNGRKFEVGPV